MDFLSNLISGLSLGSIYALIALGYTMVYGIAKMLNFAHGDIIMVGAFTIIVSISTCGLPVWVALILSVVMCTVLGVVTERVAYKPLRKSEPLTVLITAIGVSYLLENLATYLFTAIPKAYPEIPFLKKILTFGGITTSLVTLLTPVLTVVLVVLLMQLINHTKIGMAMRAVSKDTEASRLMGIKVDNTISMTFIIGCLLAGIGAILYFTDRMTVYPYSGSLPGLKCFVAAVLGGIGSIPGAVIGGFIIGICETFLVALGYSTFSDAFTFLLLIIILLVRPTGLFGEAATDKV